MEPDSFNETFRTVTRGHEKRRRLFTRTPEVTPQISQRISAVESAVVRQGAEILAWPHTTHGDQILHTGVGLDNNKYPKGVERVGICPRHLATTCIHVRPRRDLL